MTQEELTWSMRLVAQYFELPLHVVSMIPYSTFLEMLHHALDEALEVRKRFDG